MEDMSQGSITRWIGELKQGDPRAAAPLFDRYYQRIVGLARARLGRAAHLGADEEDAALSVFLDLFEGAPRGKFPLLDDRDDLWSLLAVITARKVTDLRRRQGRAMRGGGRIVGESDIEGDEIGRAADAGPGPDLAVMMAEEFRLRIEALDDDQIRQVALLRLDGYSNEEIAARMGCADPDGDPTDQRHPGNLAEGRRMSDEAAGSGAGSHRAGLASRALRQESACHRFESAWRAGRRPRIEDQLADVPEAERAALFRELILLEIELRYADGESPTADDYEWRFPGQGETLKMALNRPDDPGRTPDLLKGPHFAVTGGTAHPEGRFRVLRFHAEGGLGAVYVARDEELGRDVAVKTIKDPYAYDLESRTRFLLEAEVTGGLEHPGVVPVYGLDRGGDDRPYYAMRLIKGESLKDALARFHRADGDDGRDPGERALELRKLLRRFVNVCNAVGYAHSRGVIHRDLKPANVMLGPYGETLVVHWGLAKVVGRSDHLAAGAGAGKGEGPAEATLRPRPSDGPTPTRWAVGTPPYMSPEQAAADLDRIGPASDIYSLGATLYCLLTGKSPFAGKSDDDVMRDVQRGEFRPPRQLDPGIDPALEAICLRAMARRPEDRYPSCRALADDLDRWMADEPVRAWREPFARRARRWARRNRTAVTATAVALLAGVVGLSAVLVVQTRANDDLARSRAAVQARYELAVEAIKTFHTGVSEDFLLKQGQFNKQGQFKELRDRLLGSASDFYRKLGALLGRETDLASRLRSGGIELRAGRTDHQGRPQGGGAGGAPLGPGGPGVAGNGARS